MSVCVRRERRNWTSSASAGSWAFLWEDRVTNQEILCRSSMPGVEVLIMKAQLRWTGHVMRMEDSRLPNRSSAAAGRVARQSATKTPTRTLCAPVASLLKAGSILQQIVAPWKLATHNGAQAFEERRLSVTQLDIKRHARKERREANTAAAVACPVCGRRICASEFGLRSHQRSH